jgi:hypothetical protein
MMPLPTPDDLKQTYDNALGAVRQKVEGNKQALLNAVTFEMNDFKRKYKGGPVQIIIESHKLIKLMGLPPFIPLDAVCTELVKMLREEGPEWHIFYDNRYRILFNSSEEEDRDDNE